jgi:hypothetical protein
MSALEKERKTYSSLESAIVDLSQKVVGYLLENDAKPSMDFTEKYIEIVSSAYPGGSGKEKLDTVFSIGELKARGLGDEFSVMLCGNDGRKILEDFSCSLMRVEVQNWKQSQGAPCEFEKNWQDYCGP